MLLTDPAFVYRYQVTVHALSCLLLLNILIQMGVRPIKNVTPTRVWVLWLACIVVPLVQLPMSLIRLHGAYMPGFAIKDLAETSINFFWSPMCTIYVIWLVVAYIATKAPCVKRAISRSKIQASVHLFNAVAIGIVGMLSMYTYSAVFENSEFCNELTFWFFSTVAVVGTLLEQSIHIRSGRGVSLVSYTWFWFIGTWVYLVVAATGA